MKKEKKIGTEEGEEKNFCESCNIVCGEKRCPKCGSKKLRAVTNEDFCLAGRVNRFFGDNLKFNLESENIDCALMPFGTGIATTFALPLEDYLVFVRYKDLEHVRQIIKSKNG